MIVVVGRAVKGSCGSGSIRTSRAGQVWIQSILCRKARSGFAPYLAGRPDQSVGRVAARLWLVELSRELMALCSIYASYVGSRVVGHEARDLAAVASFGGSRIPCGLNDA